MRRKSMLFAVIGLLLLAFSPAVMAAEYQELPGIDVARYQEAPKVLLGNGDPEVPEALVLELDGVVYVPAEYFIVPSGIEYKLRNGDPVALVPAGKDIVELPVPLEGPVFKGSDGFTYLPMEEACAWWGIHFSQQDNIITLQR